MLKDALKCYRMVKNKKTLKERCTLRTQNRGVGIRKKRDGTATVTAQHRNLHCNILVLGTSTQDIYRVATEYGSRQTKISDRD